MTFAMIFVMMESISLMEDQHLLIAIKEMLTIMTVVLKLAQLWQDTCSGGTTSTPDTCYEICGDGIDYGT